MFPALSLAPTKAPGAQLSLSVVVPAFLLVAFLEPRAARLLRLQSAPGIEMVSVSVRQVKKVSTVYLITEQVDRGLLSKAVNRSGWLGAVPDRWKVSH